MKLYIFRSPLTAIIGILICCIFIGACTKQKPRLSPFGWSTTGLPSDSLLMQADRALMTYADSNMLDSLVKEYCELSEREDPGNLYLHRRLYWKGNARFMHGDYETGDSLRRLALEVCDSSLFPRDYRLYRMVIEQPSDFPDNSARYSRYKDDLDIFLASGDKVSSFTRAIQLSGLMSEAGMTKKSLDYAILADTLLTDSGLTTLRTNNRVNLASAYCAVGDTATAISELMTVRNSIDSSTIPSIEAIVDYNLFQISSDTTSLHRAWNTVSQCAELTKMRPLVAASMINSGNIGFATTSELNEALKLYSDYDYLPAEILEIRKAILQQAVGEGNVERMKRASEEYMAGVEEYIDIQHKGEVIAAQFAEEIGDVEERERSVRETMRKRIWIGISISILLLAMLAMMVYNYAERQKKKALYNQLEGERLRRELIANELMVVEKHKLNEKLQKRITELLEANRVEKKTADAISKIIDSVNVDKAIEHEDAEFLKNFIEKYPKVSKTGRKIALYIQKGLDTSEIAQEMNIRKESVMQARWRLRSQMGLSSDSDLDVELRKG